MWNTLIVDPMTNALLFIYDILGNGIGDFGLAIIIFTVLVRTITYPLTASQLKSSQKLQELQKSDQWQKIQTKYKDDREKLAQEQMKLYQEMGINPFGSCLPTLIQFPIIIGLYQAIISGMASTPLQLIGFSQRIYDFFTNIAELIPLNSTFLWMDLSQPERLHLPFLPQYGIPVLAILVVATSYLQTKLMTPMSTGGNDQSQAMTRMMTLYMPLFIGWIAYSYPAGLAVYFVASNLVGILQYAMMGRLDLSNLFGGKKQIEDSPSTKKPVKSKAVSGNQKPKKSRTK
jgi:YidC/Oxa1 family membrane protein insertase